MRLLVEDITVERGEGREVQLPVRGSGGACEELRVTLPAKIQDRLQYPSERIEAIRPLAAEHTDAAIADVFNRRRPLSSRGQPFTAKMITWIRCKHRIPAVKLRRPDELTVDDRTACGWYVFVLSASRRRQPSPFFRRVDSHITLCEACSAFTHVPAWTLAESLKAPLTSGCCWNPNPFPSLRLLPAGATQLPGGSCAH